MVLAVAAGFSFVGADFEPATSSRTFEAILLNIASWIARYSLPLLAALVVWAGFRIVSARGDVQQLQDAKRTLYWTLIGGVIIAGAYIIAKAIINFAAGL